MYAQQAQLDCEVAIVGSGPCGTATALHLARRAPQVASSTIVLEKARHPRPKLCGGGLTALSQALLDALDLDLVLNYVPVHRVDLRFRNQTITFRRPNAIKIVRREQFDAALAEAARERGAQIREGVEVKDLSVDAGAVVLQTSAGPIRARAVVAADGAKSTVRQHLRLDGPSCVGRAIEILTPEDPSTTPEFRDHTATFDFTPILQGLQGYAWDFPSAVDGEPFMNRGVYDCRVMPARPMADLKTILQRHTGAQGRDMDRYTLMGHPNRWFNAQGRFSAPHVLLAGDAAGSEPLVGDGISSSLWYGDVVAEELALAHESGDYNFTGYTERLLRHPLGKHLANRTRQAKMLYARRSSAALRAIWLAMQVRNTLRRPSSRGLFG